MRKQCQDVRREVTYDIFEKEIWPAIRGKRARLQSGAARADNPFGKLDPATLAATYPPSLIWTEIVSFIKGSLEALLSPKGFLEKDKYLELGKQRTPNFLGISPKYSSPSIVILLCGQGRTPGDLESHRVKLGFH